MKKGILTFVLASLLASGVPLFAAQGAADKPKPAAKDQVPMSVEDLGFSQDEIKGNPQFQEELDTRSDMLHIHQLLGLTTAALMTTQFVLGIATENSVAHGNSDTSLHTTLGLTTVAFYGATAAFAFLAPKPKGYHPSGNTEIHQDLVWIHLPLMVVTPLVGDMINDRLANHQPLGNLGLVHGVLATALLASYLSSLTVITF